MSNKKLSIYKYNDFRRYLADYFEYCRRQRDSFSIRSFAQRAGIVSHSYISAIVKGKRNLTITFKEKFANGLMLEPKELRYFNLLVDFCQAKTSEEKQTLFNTLNELRRNTSYFKLNKNHFKYLSNWYNFVIRELIVCTKWNNDYRFLASLTNPSISEKEARASVKLLLDLGLVRQNRDGSFSQSDKVITTKDVPGHIVRMVRKQFIELAARASEEISPDKRMLGSTTLTLNKHNYRKAFDIMEDARRKLILLSQEEGEVDGVYQAHLHIFPLTKDLNSGEGK